MTGSTRNDLPSTSASPIEVQLCPAPSALEFEDLLRHGDIQQLTSNTGPTAQAFRRASEFHHVDEFPGGSALERRADPIYTHPYVLSILLRNKLPRVEVIQVYPPVQKLQEAADIISELVYHLDDMHCANTQSTVSFTSTTVDQLGPLPPPVEYETGALSHHF